MSRAGVIKNSRFDFDSAVVELRRLAGSRPQGSNLTTSLRRRGGQTRRAQMTSSYQKSAAMLRHHRLRSTSLAMSMTTSFMHDRDLLLLAMWSALKPHLDGSALTMGRFFIMCGTLLSVVREPHVFLPWEDDLDVTVLLNDKDEVEEFWSEVFPDIAKGLGAHCFHCMRLTKQQAKVMLRLDGEMVRPCDEQRSNLWVSSAAGFLSKSSNPKSYAELYGDVKKSRWAKVGVTYSPFCLDINVVKIDRGGTFREMPFPGLMQVGDVFPLESVRYCSGHVFPMPRRPAEILKILYSDWRRLPPEKKKKWWKVRREHPTMQRVSGYLRRDW